MVILQFFLAAAILWVVVGLWMVIKSRSRGWQADVAFVMLWPVHWWVEVWRRKT